MFFLSLWKMSNCLKRLMSEPLPKGLEMLERYAMVGNDLLRYLTHLATTQSGTKSALLMRSTICLWGKFFFKCSSNAKERVPIGSRASKTCTMTSDESTTLCNSYQIRLLCPADIRLSLFSGLSPYSLFLRLSISCSRSYSFFSTSSISSSILPSPNFTRFLRLLGPKVLS